MAEGLLWKNKMAIRFLDDSGSTSLTSKISEDQSGDLSSKIESNPEAGASVRFLDDNENVDTPDSVIPIKKKERAGTGVFQKEIDAQNEPGGIIGALSPDSIKAFSQGALDSLFLGIPEAVAKQSGVDLNAASSEKFTSPYSYATGQTLGGFIPGGALLGTGKTALATALRSGLSGGILGLGSSLAENLKSDENKSPEELASDAFKSVAIGSVLGGIGVPAASSAVGLTGKAVGGATKFASLLTKSGRDILNELFEARTERLMRSAIKPSIKKSEQFGKLLDTYIPTVAQAAKKEGFSVDSMRSLLAANDSALKSTWNDIETALNKTHSTGVKFNTADIAGDMIRAASNPKLLREQENNASIKNSFESVYNKAKSYWGDMTPLEAEQILQVTNANLETAYEKAGGKLSIETLAKTDPELAAEVALAKGLRKKLNDIVETLPGSSYSSLKKKYGALASIRDDLVRRIGVEERQQLMGIDRLTMSGAIADVVNKGDVKAALSAPIRIAAQRAMKHMDSGDEKIRRVFEEYEKKYKK